MIPNEQRSASHRVACHTSQYRRTAKGRRTRCLSASTSVLARRRARALERRSCRTVEGSR